MMTTMCPLCDQGIGGEQIGYTNCGQESVFASLGITVCPNCGFAFASPKVPQGSLDDYYKYSYRNKSSGFSCKNQMGCFLPNSYSERAISQILNVKLYRGFKVGDKMLDIGCGYGILFHVVRQLKIETENYTIEPDTHALPYLRQMGVKICPELFDALPKIYFNGEKYNIIVMSHVLEHYNGEDILPLLEKIRNMLADDGVFICEVPNADLLSSPNSGENVPPHLSFFSKGALLKALKKSGFNIVFISGVGDRIERKTKDNPFVLVEKNSYLKINNYVPIKQIKKMLIKIMPLWLLNIIQRLNTPGFYELLSKAYFNYGEGREHLRVIAERAPDISEPKKRTA